ncbi:hypothetical protein ACPXBB_26615, partial [Escherichia coli]|uniref:hypothetical protein n=1 Tax=Escherichia coli TaxID=562 RepID=UPI003CF2620C
MAQKKPARQFLAVDEEVTMKVVRFAKYGVILQDALGNEGFLGNVGKVNGGSTKHYRLVVKIGDEVKV